jgi:hypothetical protein
MRTLGRSFLSSRAWSILIGGVVVLLALAPQAQSPVRTLVSGYIALSPGGGELTAVAVVKPGRDIYLPNVLVSLRDPSGNAQIAGPGVTDLSGRFTVSVNGPARFQVCWKTQWLRRRLQQDHLFGLDPPGEHQHRAHHGGPHPDDGAGDRQGAAEGRLAHALLRAAGEYQRLRPRRAPRQGRQGDG